MTTEDLATYRAESHVQIPLSLDENGAIFRQFGVRDVPTLIVLDRAGHLATRVAEVTPALRQELAQSITPGVP